MDLSANTHFLFTQQMIRSDRLCVYEAKSYVDKQMKLNFIAYVSHAHKKLA